MKKNKQNNFNLQSGKNNLYIANKKNSNISNILTVLIIFAFIFLIMFNINSSIVSVKNTLILWVNNIVPVLFPFMFLTSLLSLTNGLSFLINTFGLGCEKIFKSHRIGGYILIMSVLCGYPMGATLTGEYINKGVITSEQGNKILTFCACSGPLFIIGTVGVCFFNNYLIGIKIFIFHLISSLLCGLVLRNFLKCPKSNQNISFYHSDNVLYEAMSKAVTNILIVGGYIVIFSIVKDLLFQIQFVDNLLNNLSQLFNIDYNLLKALISGLIEITSGLKSLSLLTLSQKAIITLASCIISFGGICVTMQSLAVCKINKKVFILSKFLQVIINLILCLIFIK